MKKSCFLKTLVIALLVILVVLLAALAARSNGAQRPGGAIGGATGPVSEIQWDGTTECYPKEMVIACQKVVKELIRKSRRFGPVSASEREELTAEARRLSREFSVRVSGSQLIAMRDMEVALESQSGGVRALRHGPEMLAASKGGESVVTIAERLRLPPMAALRQILLEEKHSAAAVRAMIVDPSRMPARLAREAQAIFEADLGSRFNASQSRARSQAYEDALGAHLRRLGLKFQTEDELRHAHRASNSQSPLLTPDFLLSRPVRINKSMVHWIDAKDYPMYGSRLVARNLASQATKYTKAFGPGAMVFSGGVMCDAHVGDQPLLLLDGTHVRVAHDYCAEELSARSNSVTTGSDGSITAYPRRSSR